ncbi:MAG: C4-dicarboxylate ABC transporter substrate-binding protein [Sneathiella sp.]|nr:MAG: C4-dicarboxylate ABC transporter substrate-binding protein [Sneathiella sp.]
MWRNAICAASVAAVALSAGTANAEEKFDLANAYGATSIHAEGNVVFAEALAEASGKDIIVTVHPGGSLGYKSADHFDAVRDGAVDIADTPANFLGGIDPYFLISSMPFLVKSVDEAKILLELAKPEYERILEANGQKFLYASPWPASGIWSKDPVKSAADLAGVKIRTFDPNGTKALKAINAAPIQLAWADVVPQLATGGIDAVLTSAEGGVSQKFVEHTKYFTEINYALPLNIVHMNKAIFDGLSSDQQKMIMDAAAIASDRNWAEVVGRTEKNYAQLKKDGGIIVTEGTEVLLVDLSKAGDVVLAEWLEKTGDRGTAAIAAFRAKTGQK